VLQYQRHAIDWHLKLYPNNTEVGGITYPQGLVENLDTEANQLFARIQYSYKFWRDMAVLAGVEDTLFIYTGDHSHTANVDINTGGDYMPLTQLEPLRPELEYVRNKPVDNFGVYAQLTTGRIFKRILSATAGLRYDLQFFDYVDVADPARPTLHRNLSQASPRIAVVVFPWRELILKAMVDWAFRAPAPAELFGANTFTLASNPGQLKPESITTFDLSADLLLWRHLNLHANWFYETFENQIAYSVSNANLSTNLYSRTVTGIETEVIAGFPVGGAGKLNGFFNYTFVHLIEEKIEDPTIAKSDQLTWAPAHVFSIGINYVGKGFNASIQGHYQGEVLRRSSDNAPMDYSSYRPASVKPWFTVDARLSYQVTDWIRLGIQGTNLFNARGYLIKNNNFPFDYQIDGVRVLGTMQVDFRSFIRPL
jgi:iron complex outermembrane receptor protein